MSNQVESEERVRRLVYDWFEKITDHAPIEAVLGHLVDDSPYMRMHFPDREVQGVNDFRSWYSDVTNRYFDQAHIVKNLSIRIDGDTAQVDVQVEWNARYWDPPSSSSTSIRMDAFQKWTVKRHDNTELWGIKRYTVENLYPVAEARV